MIRINLLPAARKQAKASSSGPSGTPTVWFVGYAVV